MTTDTPLPELPALSAAADDLASDRREDRRVSRAVDGSYYEPDARVWRFETRSRVVVLDFGMMEPITTSGLLAEVRQTLELLVETRNLNSVDAGFRQLRVLLIAAQARRRAPVDAILVEDIAAWVKRGNGAYRGQLEIVVEAAADLDLQWFTHGARTLLEQVHIPPKTELEAVRTWDPKAGPYRPAEDAVLKAALDAGFNDGKVNLFDYALARLIRGLGSRPAQVAALKVGDLRRENGRAEIRIPVVKERGTPERGAFLSWKPLAQGLADILLLHIETNVLPHLAAGADPDLAPLFPARRGPIRATQKFDSHMKGDNIMKRFKRAFGKAPITSPISGMGITVNPRRDRHTVLTSLAMNGCTAAEIAANAGHKNAASCDPYIDASIEHHQRMETLVGPAFVPIADRFLGHVVDRAQDKTAIEDPDAVLVDRALDGLGSCGVGGCTAIDAGAAPLACYTCRRFRAWSDAPHAKLLEVLVKDRSRLVEAGHPEVAETRTPTIVAITDLLENIRQQKDTTHG